ncbi:MAG: SprB repeat-containing protein, partial [Cyclobacteriaceae bacterium]|nr:SprB repeat-containing protein [Cyclobacteriaceae bacterium]
MRKVLLLPLLVFLHLFSASLLSAQTEWYSYAGGGAWDDPTSWTLDASGNLFENPGNSFPQEGDIVSISSGHTVTIANSLTNLEVASIDIRGILDVRSSSGHNFNVITGSGRVRLSGADDGTGRFIENFPSGITSAGFGDSEIGGTVEVYGNNDVVFNQNRNFRRLEIEVNENNRVKLVGTYNISGSLFVQNGQLQFGEEGNNSAVNLVIGRDWVTRGTSNFTGSVGVSPSNGANIEHRVQLEGNFRNDEATVILTQATAPTNNTNIARVNLEFVNTSQKQDLELNGPTRFHRIGIIKGDPAFELNMTASDASFFELFGRRNESGPSNPIWNNPNAFGLVSGTVRLGQGINIQDLNTNGNYNINVNARLLVDGGSFTKNQGLALVVYGKLQVDNGTFEVGNGGVGRGIVFRNNGITEINGGNPVANTINNSVIGGQQNGGYIQTGGTMTFTGKNTSDGAISVFSMIEPDNVFIMSGGTLRINNKTNIGPNRGTFFVNSDPSNINISGGTIELISDTDAPYRISSRAPFWNLILRSSTTTTGGFFELSDTNSSGTNLAAQPLRVLNDFTIRSGTSRTQAGNTFGTYFRTNGQRVDIGRNFRLEDNGVFDIWSGNANNEGSSTVRFLSDKNASLYVGNITGYTNALVGYQDPEGAEAFQDWELPFHRLIIDKPGARLSLSSKNPSVAGSTDNAATGGGNKNINDFRTNLVKVTRRLEVLRGTFDQVDPNNTVSGTPVTYSLRLYAPETVINGTLFTYNPNTFIGRVKDGMVKFRLTSDTSDRVIQSGPNASIGNVRVNLGNSNLRLTSDLVIRRMEYRFGRVNLGTFNLQIDELDFNMPNNAFVTYASGRPIFDENNIFLTEGNTSDGGLSLKVPRRIDNTYSSYVPANDRLNRAEFLVFPLGFNSEATGDFEVNVGGTYIHNNFNADEGYIQINLTDEKLKFFNPDATGDRFLRAAWRVRSSGFENQLPTVSHAFQFREGQDIANQANQYVPGSILDVPPFTRSFFPSNPGRRNVVNTNNFGLGDEFINTARNIIIFNGDVQVDNNPGGFVADWNNFPGPGFELKSANYTAAEDQFFQGQPQIYYSNQRGIGYDAWNNANNWSTVGHFSDVNTGTWPGDNEGDIAIMGFDPDNDNNGNASHWYQLNVDVDLAALVFAETIEDSNGNQVTRENAFFPQVRIGRTLNDVALGLVSGLGTLNIEVGCTDCNANPNTTNTVVPTFTADLGDFVRDVRNRIDYDLQGGGNEWNAFLPLVGDDTNNPEVGFPVEYPELQIKSGGSRRGLIFRRDIQVNGDFVIREQGRSILHTGDAGDINVNGDLRMTINNNDDRLQFQRGGNSRIVSVAGDILMDNSDRIQLINPVDGTPALDNLRHRLRLAGNFEMETNNSRLLLSDSQTRGIELEFFGEENAELNRNNSDINRLQLHRILMNKAALSNSFTINHPFTLGASSAGSIKALELLNGTLALNHPSIDVALSTGGSFQLPFIDNPTIQSAPGSAGLTLLNGSRAFIRGNDTGVLLDGKITIDGGFLDMDDTANNGNNFIQYSASNAAEIELISGDLVVGSQIRRSIGADGGTLKYTQTGGRAIIGKNAAPLAQRGVFEVLNEGSSFTLTGADSEFIVVRQNTNNPESAAFILEPGNANIASNTTFRFGNEDTGVAQINFGIRSSIALSNVLIDADGTSFTARLNTVPLTINRNITISDNATLDANGLNLTINGDWINNGAFEANENVTFFSGSNPQSISGSGTSVFHNLNKNTNNILTTEKEITVSNRLIHASGILDDGGNDIRILRNAEIDALHRSPAGSTGNGLYFTGTEQQQLVRSSTGESQLGIITINNPNNVIIPTDAGFVFNINRALRLEEGQFNIASNFITILQNAEIIPVNAFGPNNRIRTSGSFTNAGVRKRFNTINTATNFFLPIGGSNKYTPINLDITNSSAGAFTFRPANERHPTIVAPDGDPNNVLQYYFVVNTAGISDFTGNLTFTYEPTDIALDGASIEDYQPARLFAASETWDKSFGNAAFDQANNQMTFELSGEGDDNISGDYTAGIIDSPDIADAIPDDVLVFNTGTSGNFVDPGTWQETALVPAGGPIGSIINVTAGTTLRLSENGARVWRTNIAEGAVLEVPETQQHRLGTVTGRGRIRLISSGTSASLPAGQYENFFLCNGGEIEYAGTGNYDILGNIPLVRRVILSGSGQRRLPNITAITICSDFIVDGPDLINNNNTGEGTNMDIGRDLIINSGDYNLGNNNFNRVARDIIASGGRIIGGADNSELRVARNINTPTTAYDVNNVNLLLNGSERQNIVTFGDPSNITPEVASFRQITLNNSRGAEIAAGSVLRARFNLTFQNGILFAQGDVTTPSLVLGPNVVSNNVTGAGASSYIDGAVRKENIPGNATFRFPIGDAGRFGRARLTNPDPGGNAWNIRYVNSSPLLAYGNDTNIVPNNEDILSCNEYWEVVGTVGSEARIGIRADAGSDVQNLGQVLVLKINAGSDQWLTQNTTGTISGKRLADATNFSGGVDAVTFGSDNVNVNSLSSVNAGEDFEICEGEERRELSGFSPAGGIWTNQTAAGLGVVEDPNGSGNWFFDPDGVAPGEYTLRYEDQETCDTFDEIVVTVIQLDPIDAGEPITACIEDGVVDLFANPGLTPGNGTWSGPGVSAGVFSPTESLIGQDIILTYTFEGPSGCVVTDEVSAEVTRRPLRPSPIQGPVNLCEGQAGIQYSIDEQPEADSYEWQLPAGVVFTTGTPQDERQISVDVISEDPGVLGSIIVRAVSECGAGPEETLSIELTPTPNASLNGDNQNICADEELTFPVEIEGTANLNIEYRIEYLSEDEIRTFTVENVSGTGGSITFIPEFEGDLEITLLDARFVTNPLCEGNISGNYTATVNPRPDIFELQTTDELEFCEDEDGAELTLSGSQAGTTYRLLRNGTEFETRTGDGSALSFGLVELTGTYTIVAESSEGCESDMDGSIELLQNPLPEQYTLELSSNTYCEGEDGVDIGLNGSENGIVYSLFQEGNTEPIATFTGTGDPFNFAGPFLAGTYTVVAENEATNCVQDMLGEEEVIELPAPEATILAATNPVIVCEDENAQFTIEISGVAGQTYTAVYTDGTTNYTEANLNNGENTLTTQFQVSANTILTLVSLVSNDSGCEAAPADLTGQVNLEIIPTPLTNRDFATQETEYCDGEEVIVEIQNSQTGVDYQVFLNGDAEGTSQEGNGGVLTINLGNGLDATDYTLTIQAQRESCDPIALDGSFDFTIAEPITATAEVVDVLCNGEETGSITIVDVLGGFGDYQFSLNGGAFQASNTFENLAAGTYSVVVRDNNECQFEINDIVIGQPDELTASENEVTDALCFGDEG